MLCGSGLKAVALGYQAVSSDESAIVVAGGQESMSQVWEQISQDSKCYFSLCSVMFSWFTGQTYEGQRSKNGIYDHVISLYIPW